MGDCNLNLSYGNNSPKREDKYCKYSYCTWCPTCEKSSPRRRSRSETTECCRKKCKEMKSHTPKRYCSKSREYENMDYDGKDGWSPQESTKEPRFECCRVRANLCELPTSYISNNCHYPTNVSKTTGDNADYDCLIKTVKNYDQTLKFVDFNNHLPNLGNKMQDRSATKHEAIDSFKFKLDTLKPHYKPPKPEPTAEEAKNASLYKPTSCREFCPLVDLQMHDLPNRRSVCYDTNTYFNQKIDTANLQDRYSKEVEYLREKLRMIKNSSSNCGYRRPVIPPIVVEPVVVKPKEVVVPINKEVKQTNVAKAKFRRTCSPKVLRNKKKVGLSTKITNSKTIMLRKRRNKSASSSSTADSSSDSTDSDYSGSDESENDDEPESLSEPSSSTDDSNKDPAYSSSSVSESNGAGDSFGWPARSSLFPNIPPYIRFNPHDMEIPYKVPNGRKFFKWKLSTITPILVRKTLTNSGFALVRKSNQWLGTWGKHMKSPMFKTLKDVQKLNHFPGTFQLGRKDKLWRNFQRLINKFGHKEFGFLPHTYILPLELKLLKQNWEFKNGSGGEMWIIKPPASARGVGIKVINKWSHLPKKTSLVVQKYISNPYLINGSKFDLRLYVLVTSFHPLRIYLYPEGLARFASAKYSEDAKDLKDRYMHLTNYSINKLSSQYTANEDANACHGHKWTLSKLMEYLQDRGTDTKALWKNLQQLVIKTIISAEAPITQLCDENINNLYNCYELFGIDVLLDNNLKPWLLEVNISPSLHSASPLDEYVKGPMVQTLFDLAQFHFPPRLAQTVRQSPPCFEPKLYTTALTKRERTKHEVFTQFSHRDDYLSDILDELTGDDVRQLTRAEDEFVVKGRFERIFPTPHSYKYLEFMEARYYNRLFDAWEAKYAGRRTDGIVLLREMCAQKIHLKVASQTTLAKKSSSTTPWEITGNRPLEEIMQQASITKNDK